MQFLVILCLNNWTAVCFKNLCQDKCSYITDLASVFQLMDLMYFDKKLTLTIEERSSINPIAYYAQVIYAMILWHFNENKIYYMFSYGFYTLGKHSP